jgi:hypothetical protein
MAMLVLVLGMASQPLLTQAQNDLGYTVIVSNLRTDYCPGDQETYHIHVGINGSIGPNDPLERSYAQIKPGVVARADVKPGSTGDIISSNIVQRYSPTPDLAIADTVDFTFKAGKEGSGTINFRASVDGIEATPFEVPVKVHACKYQVSGSSSWSLPVDGGVYTLTVALMPVLLSPGTTAGTVSGQTTAVWKPDVSGPPCAFPYSIAPSKVTIRGTLADDGSLKQLTMTYGSVLEKESVVCSGYTKSDSHTFSFSNLQFKPLLDQPNPLPHSITSPGTVRGTATIYVHLAPSDEP